MTFKRRLAGAVAALVVVVGCGPPNAARAQTPETAAESLDLIPWAPSVAPPADDEKIDDTPAWRRFAVAPPAAAEGAPMIALLIDDMGEALAWTQRAMALPGPLTMSFFPHAEDLAEQAEAARAAGHEVMLHLPMQPDDDGEDPGPNPLILGLDEIELDRRIMAMLDSFTGYVGVNNHMGSRFTRDWSAMEQVLGRVGQRGLLFVDSRTAAESVGESVARDLKVPALRRDVFIDHDGDPVEIAKRLAELETLARERGFAIGIAHPRPQTMDALEAWLPQAVARGIVLAPISAVIGRGQGVNFAAAP
jgi:polysaccharide deacetylase 2 family uncharacterized protein YibQ